MIQEKIKESEVTLVGNGLWTDWIQAIYPKMTVLSVNKSRFKSSFAYRYKLARSLNQGFQEIHYPTYSKEWDGVFLSLLGQTKNRRTWKGDCLNISPRLNQLGESLYSNLHEDSNIESMTFEGEKHESFYKLTVESKGFILGQNQEELSIKAPFAIVSPGAGAAKRMFNLKKMAELSDYIEGELGVPVYLCGAPGEEKLADFFSVPPERNLIGKTSITELVQLTSCAAFVLCNETGIAQIADLFARKGVCLLGGGHFGRFMPKPVESKLVSVYERMDCFGCNWKCVKNHPIESSFPCIDGIKVDKVKTVINQLFKEERNRSI